MNKRKLAIIVLMLILSACNTENSTENSDKWKNSPDYGKFKSGYIGLQDHASPIWFRNIKIKKL